MRTAAAYIRVSTADQLEYSPDSQLRLIKEYAKKNGMRLSNDFIFQDDGISGRNAEKRPAFQKMISTAKQKLFDVILVYSSSRFARNLEDSIVYKSMLQRECGVDVISITQPFVDKKTDMLTSAIYGVMDEWYSIDLAENVKRGMTQKAMSGGFQSNPPLGYKIERTGEPLTICEDEAKTIKMVFRMFLHEGLSQFQIARKLNSLGIRSKKGNGLQSRTINYILQNPIYKGYTRWTPEGRTRFDFRNKNSLIIKSSHEGIINEKEFDLVQKKIDESKTTIKWKSRPLSECKHWLSGLLKCSNCGRTLVVINTKALSFQCGGYAKGACLISHSITFKKLEGSILKKFESILNGVDSAYIENIRIIQPDIDEKELLLSEKKRIENKLKRAKEAFLNGIDDITEYRQSKNLFQSELENIETKIGKFEIAKIDEKSFKHSVKNVYDLLTDKSSSLKNRQNAVRGIVDKIIYDKFKKSLTIYFFWKN